MSNLENLHVVNKVYSDTDRGITISCSLSNGTVLEYYPLAGHAMLLETYCSDGTFSTIFEQGKYGAASSLGGSFSSEEGTASYVYEDVNLFAGISLLRALEVVIPESSMTQRLYEMIRLERESCQEARSSALTTMPASTFRPAPIGGFGNK